MKIEEKTKDVGGVVICLNLEETSFFVGLIKTLETQFLRTQYNNQI